MQITAEERHFIRHALGLDQVRNGIGYRNRFFAGGKDQETGEALVEKGMAVVFDGNWFVITTKGFNAARKGREKMDAEETARMKKIDQRAA